MGNRIPSILYRRGPLYANSRRLHEDTEKQHEEEVKTETIPSEPETQANTRRQMMRNLTLKKMPDPGFVSALFQGI